MLPVMVSATLSALAWKVPELIRIAGLSVLLVTATCQSAVQLTLMEADRPHILIGHIENRDLRFNPYDHKNFADMLSFELIRAGYTVSSLDFNARMTRQDKSPTGGTDATHPAEDYPLLPAQETYIDSKVLNERDPAGDMLPRAFRNLAGEARQLPSTPVAEPKRLLPEEIRKYIAGSNAQFFFQGSIGRSESGMLLELSEDTLIFLEIHDRRGSKIAAMNVVLENRSLKRAELLRKTAIQIARRFAVSHREALGQAPTTSPDPLTP